MKELQLGDIYHYKNPDGDEFVIRLLSKVRTKHYSIQTGKLGEAHGRFCLKDIRVNHPQVRARKPTKKEKAKALLAGL